jgi:hypothetical protein
MKHITPFFESEDLIGDLRSMGYKDLEGRFINYTSEGGYNGWYLIAMRVGEEKQVTQALMRNFGIPFAMTYKNKPIHTLSQLVSYMHHTDRWTYSSLSEELEVNKQIIAPQILSVSGGNPYKLVEEMRKFFTNPIPALLDADLEDEIETIPL